MHSTRRRDDKRCRTAPIQGRIAGSAIDIETHRYGDNLRDVQDAAWALHSDLRKQLL